MAEIVSAEVCREPEIKALRRVITFYPSITGLPNSTTSFMNEKKMTEIKSLC